MIELPSPDWYADNVLADAAPGRYESVPRGAVAEWRSWWRALTASPEPLLVRAARQGFVLSTADCRALGVSRQNARSAVRRGDWTSAGRGYVAPLRVPGDGPVASRRRHALVASAAQRNRSDEVVCGRSSAVLHGLPTLRLPDTAELTARHSVGTGVRAVSHVYAAALADEAVANWYGIRVTTVARTLVDLARHDRRDGIMAADAALRAELVERHEIDAVLSTAVGWPGVRQARAVLALAAPLAESPLESLTRLALHEDGFPTPELQVEIGGYRADLLFREQGVILEADGMGKYTIEELRREKRREHRLRALGYRVERVGWDDIVVRWRETRVWLRAALRPRT